MNSANLLGINGGACNGVKELHVLKELHDIMGGKFLRHWDIIGGTSTGALILALLVLGYTPAQILEIYNKELPIIFKKCILRQVRDLSKYDRSYLDGLVRNYVGNKRLGDFSQKFLIPTVNINTEKTKIFKSYDLKDADFYLADVVIASASAPTYFPAHKIGNCWYNDGGLSSNNPADILLNEYLEKDENEKPIYDKINILSITTGHKRDAVTNAEIKGNLRSVPNFITNMLLLQDDKSHGNIITAYKNKVAKGCYIRCEGVVEHSSGESDDVSAQNMYNMKLDGELAALQNRNKLKEFHLNTLKND